MVQEGWYDPAEHKRFPAVPDYKEIQDATDPLAAYEAWEQRKRERAVKLAHLRYIEGKLERCYLFNGVHNVQQQCRHLVHEFEQTKNEVMGWKQGRPLPVPLSKPGRFYDLPPGSVPLTDAKYSSFNSSQTISTEQQE